MPTIALQGLVVSMFACGGGSEEHHSAAVTSSGAIYTWGSGGSGQLGHGDLENLVMPQVVSSPLLQGQQVVQVACGSAHTVVITHTGAILSWGWGHFGQLGTGSTTNSCEPVRVVGLDAVVIYRIACGSAHSAAISDTGQLYTWGWGVNGQLGHGDDATCLTPTLVKRLQPVYISHVSCGLAHTVAVSEVDKQVYSWGWDEYGQLGQGIWDIFGANKNRTPRPVRELQGKNIIATACGSSHTVALSAKGEAYAFGWGRDGQLGLGSATKEKKTPVLIKGLADIVHVSASGSHSIAVDSSGCAWVWGLNLAGQLGLGHTSAVSTPTRVAALEGRRVRQVACAGGVKFGHTLALMLPDNDRPRHPLTHGWPAAVGDGEGSETLGRDGKRSGQGGCGRSPVREESDEALREVLHFLSQESATDSQQDSAQRGGAMPAPAQPMKPTNAPPPVPDTASLLLGLGPETTHGTNAHSAHGASPNSDVAAVGVPAAAAREQADLLSFEAPAVAPRQSRAGGCPADEVVEVGAGAEAAVDASVAGGTGAHQGEGELRWGDPVASRTTAGNRAQTASHGARVQPPSVLGDPGLEELLVGDSPSARNLEVAGELPAGGVAAPRERLTYLCERVRTAQQDHSVGLSRLLSEFEEVIADVRREKKELVRQRQDLAREEDEVHERRRGAAAQLAVEAAAERFERAAECEREVRECDAALQACDGRWQQLQQRYEALDARQEECQRKTILARREAAKFLSSVEHDARAKAQQYSHDAHARLEEQRVGAVRRAQALEGEEASLRAMETELDAALAEISGASAADLSARERRVADAQDARRAVAEQREAIEEQIRTLQRALAVKREEEERACAAEASAQAELQQLLDADSANSAALRAERGRVTRELNRLANDVREAAAAQGAVAEGDAQLQAAEELCAVRWGCMHACMHGSCVARLDSCCCT